MDGYLSALGVDIICGIGLYLIKKNFLSNLSLLNNDQSIHDFYKSHVETISIVNGQESLIKENGCNVIMSGYLLSNSKDKNKIFNDVVLWCQTIFLNSRNENNESVTPISYNIMCSPLVILKRKIWKYYMFPITETIVVQNPVELEGLEQFYEVVLDKFMKHNEVGYRIMDKMIFSGTPATIKGWLTCDENGQYFISRNEEFNKGVFQISRKSLNELCTEINSNKSAVTVLSFCIKVTVGLGILFAIIYAYKKIRNRTK